MKKISLALLVSLSALSAQAQTDKDLVNAIINHRDGKLEQAKADIDIAILKEKVNVKPKGWFKRGEIYESLLSSADDKIRGLGGDSCANIAFKSYTKAIELDKPNGEYGSSAQRKLMGNVRLGLINEGAKYYNEEKYRAAIQRFQNVLAINPKDTTSAKYAAYSAMLTDMSIDSLMIFFNQYIKINPKDVKFYIEFERKIQKDGKTEQALDIISKGKQQFPNDKTLALDELNIFLSQNRGEEAKKKLVEAIKLDPQNANLYLILGSLYEKEAELKKAPQEATDLQEKAIQNYTKAIELDANSFEGNFNVGAIHYNRGALMLKKVDDMDLKTYQRLGKKTEADAYTHLQKSLPFFEKAYAINPKDENLLRAMKTVYTRLKKEAQAKKIETEMNALGF